MAFQLGSGAFANNGHIPDRYTCKGEEVSPPMKWRNVPSGTATFALVMDDLDVPLGTLCHWVVYNIPGGRTELPEALPFEERLPMGAFQGRNGVRRVGYMGPCPPFGGHRYRFTLFALDTIMEHDPKMNRKRLKKAMAGHILGKAELVGNYSKKGDTRSSGR